MSGTGALDHFGRNFAGVGALHLVCAVFSAESDEFGVDFGSHGSQVNEGSANHHVANGFVCGQCAVQFFCQSNAFLQVQVHFPVACYDFLSHVFLV